MSENIVIQLIVGFVTIIGSILAVTLILARKLGNSNSGGGQTNQQKGIDDRLANGTKTLASRFEEQVTSCNKLWMGHAKFEGTMEQYMVEIRDRLDGMAPRRRTK